jgi:hypothetical protein
MHVDPWGSLLRLFLINGLAKPCELDCSSIVSTFPLQGGDTNDVNEPKQGAFCVESPKNSAVDVDDVDDQT